MTHVTGSLPSPVVVTAPAAFNLADLFEAVADERGECPAVVAGGERTTYRGLDDLAARWATALRDLGVEPGARVAMMLRNSTAHVAGLLGAFKLRAVPLNVNEHYTAEELRHLLGDADPAVVVCEDETAATVGAALDLVVASTTVAPTTRVCALGELRAAVAGRPGLARRTDRRGDDPYLLYTGGTTGLPKGVEWRQEDLYFAALGGDARVGPPVRTPGDVVAGLRPTPTRTLVACPLSHGTAQWVTLGALLSGGTAVLSTEETFRPEALLDLAEREAAGQLVLVGDAFAVPLAEALEEHPGRWALDELVAVASGGAPLAASTAQRLLAHLPGAVVVDGYGTTETGGQARRIHLPVAVPTAGPAAAGGADPVDPARAPDIAAFAPGPETGLISFDGRLLAREDAELGRVGRRGRLPIGYRNDPTRTAVTFPVIDGERWALTGDLGRWRPDGTIELVGRGQRTVNSGGEKVDALEVEGVVRSHPAVADAMVVGVPDARFGEVVGVLVRLAPGASLSVEQLARFCRSSLARFKLPRHVLVVEDLPRTRTGKLDYRAAARHLEVGPAVRR